MGKDFGGGVIVISHNREFADSVSTEKWVMDKGRLRCEGEVVGEDVALDKAGDGPDEVFGGAGNKINVQKQKNLSDHKKKACLEEEEMYELMDELEKMKSEIASA